MKKIYLIVAICLSGAANAFAQTCPTMTSSNSMTICSGVTVNIALTADISSTFTWIATDNANTTGESSTMQTTSTISDVLNNNSTSTQTVSYTVTPTATAGGCVGTAQIVSITIMPTPDVIATPAAQTICSDSTTLIVLSSVLAGTIYSWTVDASGLALGAFDDGNDTIQQTLTNSGSTAGTAVYTITPTASGCSGAPITYTITVNGIATLNSSLSPAPVCSGSTVTYAATSATAGATFTWSRTTVSGISEPGTSGTGNVSEVLTNTTTSPINVTYSYSTSAGGCSNPGENVVVSVNPYPVVTVNSATICAGTSVTLTAGGANTYSWSNSATGPTLTDSPTATTSYTVTGTTSGCSSSAVGTVTVMPLDDASFSYQGATFCAPATAVATKASPPLPASGTYSMTPTDPNMTLNTTTGDISVLAGATVGPYVVTLATAAACPNSYSLTINVVANPDATFSYSGPYCKNATPNPTITQPAGSTPGAFSATPAGMVFVSTSTGQIDLSASAPGTYTVTNTIPAGGGCPAVTATNTITINPVPVTTVSNTTVCSGTAGTITTGGATSYTWSGGSTGAFLTDSPTATTSYTVTGTSNGCSSSAIGTITVQATPIVTVNDPTICQGLSASLTASGATTYSWSNSSNANPLVVSPTGTTSYTVTGTTAGCTGQDVATVTVNLTAVITVNSVTICQGQAATLTAAGGSAYVWSTGASGSSITVSPASTTSYTVSDNSAGCSSSTVGSVNVIALPIISMSTTNTSSSTPCTGYVAANTTGSGPFTYSWDDAPTINTFERKNMCSGTYTVTVSTFGCASSAVGKVGTDTLPSTTCEMNIHTITDNATVGNSDGAAHASIPGGGNNGCTPPYTYDFNGTKTTVTASPYKWDQSGLAEGFYTINVKDANGLQTSFVFVVSTAAKTFTTTPTGTSTATLTATAVPSCTIIYEDIKSIKIFDAIAGNGNGKYTFTWEVTYNTSTNATQYFDHDYNFTGLKGVVTVITNLFCSSRVTGIAKGMDTYDLGKLVGIESLNNIVSEIYPNPFNDKLNVVLENSSTIKITDLSGKEVYESKLNSGVTTIETGSLSEGPYFITIQNAQTSETKKLMKIK